MNSIDPSPQTCELLSALADGELGGEACVAALQGCDLDVTALASWSAYHLIGEVLRLPVKVVPGEDLVFLGRLNQRLAQEHIIGTFPQQGSLDSKFQCKEKSLVNVIDDRGAAANDGSFRWKLVAGLASLAAVSVLAWNASGLLPSTGSPQIAETSTVQQVLVASPLGPMVRDARLEELLSAHRQLGGGAVVQVPSGFLQNAAYETTQDARR